MARPALSDVLIDFAPRTGHASAAHANQAHQPSNDRGAVAGATFAPAAPSAAEIADMVAAARAAAEAETTARLAAEHDTALAAERQIQARQVEDTERRLGGDAAAAILKGLEDMEQRLSDLATSITARILGVFVSDAVRDKSVAALARAVHAAIADTDVARIRVIGPQRLFAALAERMGDHAVLLRHVESDAVDVTVDIDGRLFETRLAEWSDALLGALA